MENKLKVYDEKKNIKFLHIGKTGGSFIKYALNLFDVKNKVTKCNHLNSIIEDDFDGYYIFFVRDPVGRFVSGFISRLRMGKPKNCSKWNKDESIAFNNFKTPNELAEALSSSDENIRNKAEHAMNSITHLKMDLSFYLKSKTTLNKNISKILYIGKLETINQCVKNIIELLGYKYSKTKLDFSDEIKTHKTPDKYKQIYYLSELGRKNIVNYYKKDYDIIDFLISKKMINEDYEKYLSNRS